jgi:hypothetical protein
MWLVPLSPQIDYQSTTKPFKTVVLKGFNFMNVLLAVVYGSIPKVVGFKN